MGVQVPPRTLSDLRIYAALCRERATRKQTSLTYASRVHAEQMAAVNQSNGGDLHSAQRVMAAATRRSPLVREVDLEHISMLTAVARVSSSGNAIRCGTTCRAKSGVTRSTAWTSG